MKINPDSKLTVVDFLKTNQFTGKKCLVFNDIPSDNHMTNGILIHSNLNDEKAIALIKYVRKSLTLRLIPLFVTQEYSPYLMQLIDGITMSIEEAYSLRANIISKQNILSPECLKHDDLSLIAFMISRNIILKPLRSITSNLFYEYLLAEMFFLEKKDTLTYLSGMVSQKMLENDSVEARIRTCPHDNSAQINYVDVCPSCNSIKIEKKPFLHCFTCGHVAPQEEFISGSTLSCPNCRARLRHIGSDYDRPLESYKCVDCGTTFVEPDVVAVCILCGRRLHTDELNIKTFYTLQVSEKGHNAAIIGHINDIYDILDDFQFVHKKYFETILGWMVRVVRRYPDAEFSVIGIKFSNVLDLVAHFGRSKVEFLLQSFSGRLKKLLRTTDITTRTDTETLWIILPRTNSSGCAILSQRILEFGEIAEQSDGSRIEFILFQHTETGDRGEDADPALIMLEYASALQE